MPTTTLTTSQLTLIKRMDMPSSHLIVVARGRQSGRRFTVPEGRTVRHHIDDNFNLDINVGTLGLALRGHLQPRETHTVGYRIMDYTLMPAAENAFRAATARYPDAQWHRHVDQSGKAPGATPPVDAVSLGEGVPCDIVRL